MYARLTEEYRGELLECAREGLICGVNAQKVQYAVGDSKAMVFYRSTSKPIQVLPFLWHGLDEKYNLTEEEIAIMSSSQQCEWVHLGVIQTLLAKSKIDEEDLIMCETYPLHRKTRYEMIRRGMAPRKIFHDCIGKHIACMLLMREKGEDERNYGDPSSFVQQTILDYISLLSGYPRDKIKLGIDGCGVPVFAVPIENIAQSYLRLVKPDLIGDERLASLIRKNTALMNRHSRLISAENALDQILLEDPNIIAKIGAQGIFCFALRSEELAFACKIMDGSLDPLPLVVLSILKEIGYENHETIRKLENTFPAEYKNRNGVLVTNHKSGFHFSETT